MRQMLDENSHNKYTTLYYLLLKKSAAGKLEPDEVEAVQEWALAQRQPSPAKSFGQPFAQRAASREREREAKTDRALPLLHPQLNIGDITYSVKEKITINTAPHRTAAQSFGLYARGPPREEVPQSFVKTAAPHDYRRASEREDLAAKSFDFARRKPQATATDFYAREARRSGEDEPKSRKLLEMMLKRMSKLAVDDEPQLSHARSFSRNAAAAKTWENKSVSLDHNKKKLNATLGRQLDTARRSSRDSQRVFAPGVAAFAPKTASTVKSKPITIRNLRSKAN